MQLQYEYFTVQLIKALSKRVMKFYINEETNEVQFKEVIKKILTNLKVSSLLSVGFVALTSTLTLSTFAPSLSDSGLVKLR